MELQAESERIKRSKILNSEGERQALINIAEGDKSAAILEGEGVAIKIMQEARAIVESLSNIANSIQQDDEMIALKLKLTEKYLEAMSDILGESSIIVLPPSNNSNDMTNSIATGLELYKKIMGSPNIPDAAKALAGHSETYEELNQRLRNLNEERKKLTDSQKQQTGSNPKYEFMDDKILYSTE